MCCNESNGYNESCYGCKGDCEPEGFGGHEKHCGRKRPGHGGCNCGGKGSGAGKSAAFSCEMKCVCKCRITEPHVRIARCACCRGCD